MTSFERAPTSSRIAKPSTLESRMRQRERTALAAAASGVDAAAAEDNSSRSLPALPDSVIAKLDRLPRSARTWTLEEDMLLLRKRRYHISQQDWEAAARIQIPGRESSKDSPKKTPVQKRLYKLQEDFANDTEFLEAAYLLNLDVYHMQANASAKAETARAAAVAKEAAADAADAKADRIKSAAARKAGTAPSFPLRCAVGALAPGAIGPRVPPLRLSYDTPMSLKLPHGPVPFGAVINYIAGTALIPAAWRLQIGAFSAALGATDLPVLAIEDVRRSTTVGEISALATRWLVQQRDVSIPEGARVVLALLERDACGCAHEVAWLREAATAEEADLFHRATSLGVTLAPPPSRDTVSDLWARRDEASQPAYNERPTAPEHVGMLNDLLGLSGERGADTNLQSALSEENRKLLASHLQSINKQPTRVCFQVCLTSNRL